MTKKFVLMTRESPPGSKQYVTGWGKWPEDVVSAFKDRQFEVVTVPANMKLWKMTAWPVNLKRVTPWWAAVNPWKEDKLGVRGRLKEAALNGVSANHYVRIAAAVRYDWNTLGQYQQISLRQPVKGIWGQFAPQPNISQNERLGKLGELLKQCPHIPRVLGGMGAWQLYIPNLKGEHIDVEISTDKEAEWLSFLAIRLPDAHDWSSAWSDPVSNQETGNM